MDHKPYVRYVPGSHYAVLMVHGIVGTPAQFRDLIPVIPEDWSVYNILLEGHGGTVRDFSRASMGSWKLQVDAQLHVLLARHRQILIIGHSMGTLFAIQAAVRAARRVPALFLLQVPLTPHLPPSTCISSLQLALGRVKPGSKAQAMENATAMTLTNQLWQYLGWIPRYAELLREIAATRKLLPQLKVPTKTFQSAQDELVSLRSVEILQKYPCIQNRVLPASGHFAYSPEDTKLLQKALKDLIDSL